MESFEIEFTQEGKISMKSTAVALAETARHLKEKKIHIVSMCTRLLNKRDLCDESGRPDIEVAQVIRTMIEIASYLGIPYVCFPCSSSRKIQEVGFEKVVTNEQDCLIRFAEYAQQKGVTCCVENWKEGLLSYPMDMLELLTKVDMPSLKACLNVDDTIYSGMPERWIECLKDQIRVVHFSDERGTINFQKVYQQLLNNGFSGEIIWKKNLW